MRVLNIILCTCFAVTAQLVKADDTVRLLSYTDYAPYVSDKVLEGGMMTQVIRAAYADQGVTLQVIFVPRKRGYRMVQQGEALGAFSWQRTKEREHNFIVSSALFADSNLIYTTLGDFNDWRI